MYKPTQTCTRKQVDLGFKLHKTPFFPFAEVAEVLQSSVDNRCGWSAAQDVKNSSLKLCSGTDCIMWPWVCYVEVRTDSKFHGSLATPHLSKRIFFPRANSTEVWPWEFSWFLNVCLYALGSSSKAPAILRYHLRKETLQSPVLYRRVRRRIRLLSSGDTSKSSDMWPRIPEVLVMEIFLLTSKPWGLFEEGAGFSGPFKV